MLTQERAAGEPLGERLRPDVRRSTLKSDSLPGHTGEIMTTGVAHGGTTRVAPGAYDRAFYTGIATAMALTVLFGFGQTYYFRLMSGTPATLTGGSITPTIHLHGLVFSAWVVLFLVQTLLVASRKVAVHRTLGYARLALAPTMVIVGVRTAIESAARGAAPPGADPLSFLVVPLVDVTLFTGFYSAAVVKRRNRDVHKRLMLLAYVSIITAAVARLPGILPYGPLVFFGLSFLFVVAGAVYDQASRGRIHPVYLWGGAIIALSVPGRLALSTTGAWRAFAEFLVR